MNSNLPAGAANDPRRPWEDAEPLCRSCDTDAIGEMVDQYLAEHPRCNEWDDAYEELDEMGSFGYCKYCRLEQMADDNED